MKQVEAGFETTTPVLRLIPYFPSWEEVDPQLAEALASASEEHGVRLSLWLVNDYMRTANDEPSTKKRNMLPVEADIVPKDIDGGLLPLICADNLTAEEAWELGDDIRIRYIQAVHGAADGRPPQYKFMLADAISLASQPDSD